MGQMPSLTEVKMYPRNKGVEEEHEDDYSKDSDAFYQKDFVCYSVLKTGKRRGFVNSRSEAGIEMSHSSKQTSIRCWHRVISKIKAHWPLLMRSLLQIGNFESEYPREDLKIGVHFV